MNKFTDKPKTTRQTKKVDSVEKKRKGEIIQKGKQNFIKCYKCGWIHPATEIKCRFCGAEL